MSEIRHDVSATSRDCRNASADGNVQARNPSDVTRLSIALLTTVSSSTIEIRGVLFNRLVPSHEWKRRTWEVKTMPLGDGLPISPKGITSPDLRSLEAVCHGPPGLRP